MGQKISYAQLKRKRMLVGLVGFLIGLSVGIPITYAVYSEYFSMTTLIIGLAGAGFSLLVAEKKRGLPNVDVLRKLRFEEGLKPLKLSPRDSINATPEKREGPS